MYRLTFALFIAALLFTVPQASRAQTASATPEVSAGLVVSGEGISGSVDKQHRNPVVSLGTRVSKGNTKILVDAYIPNETYEKYPIRFEFFVNRSFLTAQIRAQELPGPIGVDVPERLAKPPFNYAVVATLLHPNRQFTTTMYGIVYPTALSASLPCTLSVAGADGATTDYSAAAVNIEQTAADALALSLTEAKTEDGEESADASAAVTVTGKAASGTLSYTINGEATSLDVTGTAEITDEQLTALVLTSKDESVSLSCQ